MLSANRSNQIRREIEIRAFSFVPQECFTLRSDFLKDRQDFWESWSDLEADPYIKGEYLFRLRRYGRLLLQPDGQLLPLPHAPFFQSKENNSYAGGIARKFAPVSAALLNNRFLADLIRLDFDLLPIPRALRSTAWEIDVHQYRIVSDNEQAGYPTPEGIHSDGFDFFAVHLLKRVNVSGGISKIYGDKRQLLETLTLREPLDTLLVEDTRVMHCVTPIVPLDSQFQACRDTLILNFISKPRGEVIPSGVIGKAMISAAPHLVSTASGGEF